MKANLLVSAGHVFGPERLLPDRLDSSDPRHRVLQGRRSEPHTGTVTPPPGGVCLTASVCPPDQTVGQSGKPPDFFINLCQPLNTIPGVACPPGAAVCMDPDDGPPVVRNSENL